jgi:hypothetical protein
MLSAQTISTKAKWLYKVFLLEVSKNNQTASQILMSKVVMPSAVFEFLKKYSTQSIHKIYLQPWKNYLSIIK